MRGLNYNIGIATVNTISAGNKSEIIRSIKEKWVS